MLDFNSQPVMFTKGPKSHFSFEPVQTLPGFSELLELSLLTYWGLCFKVLEGIS